MSLLKTLKIIALFVIYVVAGYCTAYGMGGLFYTNSNYDTTYAYIGTGFGMFLVLIVYTHHFLTWRSERRYLKNLEILRNVELINQRYEQ